MSPMHFFAIKYNIIHNLVSKLVCIYFSVRWVICDSHNCTQNDINHQEKAMFHMGWKGMIFLFHIDSIKQQNKYLHYVII